jgi:hypothetical protein
MNAIANIKNTISISEAELSRFTAYANAINSMSVLGVVSVNAGASLAVIEKSFASIHQLCDQLEPLIRQFDDVDDLSESMKAALNGFDTIWLLAAFVTMSTPSNPSTQILSAAFERIRNTSALLSDLLAQLELEGVAA